MSKREIRNQVAEEIALQDSMGNKIGQRWLPPTPEELLTADEHTKVHLPLLEAQSFDHSIVVASPDELSQVFDAVEKLAGGRYTDKAATIKHEAQHGEAAERLGQRNVRFLARLAISAPFNLPDGRRVRRVGITPSALLEDVHASRLGVGLFLGSPEDTADAIEDTKRIQTLGYEDAEEVIRRAADYNAKTRSNTYPLPRRSS
jgi:hypothetical protein